MGVLHRDVMGRNIKVGMFGSDNGNDFEVTNKRGCEVQVRYIPSGDTAWFQENRFEFTGSRGKTLQLQ